MKSRYHYCYANIITVQTTTEADDDIYEKLDSREVACKHRSCCRYINEEYLVNDHSLNQLFLL
jgi:hypothetical protein